MINKNLFDDVFLESHQKLAIKSLQTLNNCENMLISNLVVNEIHTYNLITIKNIVSDINDNKLLLNISFDDVDKFEEYFKIRPFFNLGRVFLIADNYLYTAHSLTLKLPNEYISNTYIGFTGYKKFIELY